jgi:hypothetical protein
MMNLRNIPAALILFLSAALVLQAQNATPAYLDLKRGCQIGYTESDWLAIAR